MGSAPAYEDAVASERSKKLAEKNMVIPFTRFSLLATLEEQREIDVRDQMGNRGQAFLYQMRDEENGRWLFLCNGKLPERPDLPDVFDYTIPLKGEWKPTLYDTLTGEIRAFPCRYDWGNTLISMFWHGYDCLLLWLEPGREKRGTKTAKVWNLPGDFGVKMLGGSAKIIPPVRELAFGDYVDQGLPFYTGNVTYHLPVETDGDFAIQCTHFRNPLLAVDVDGKRQGIIAYSPTSSPYPVPPASM